MLLSPLYWLIASAFLCAAAVAIPRLRRLRWPGLVLALASLLSMTPWAANAVLGALERAASRDECGADLPATLVVLAGGVERRPGHGADFEVLNSPSRRRMDRAISVWRDAPATRLWLSGGASGRNELALAGLMSAYAQWHGVPAAAIMLESGSRTTWQSAQALRELPLPLRIGLVSSASHLPRASLAFDAAGFEACGIPADHQTLDVRFPWALVPRTSALEKTEAGLHELAGLVYYRWLRWRQRTT